MAVSLEGFGGTPAALGTQVSTCGQHRKENVDIAVVGGLVSQEKNCGEVEGETVNIPKFFILVLSCFSNSSALLQLVSQPH